MSLDATIGVRFATGDENKEPLLPQIYQNGLGTNDVIFAVNYYYDKIGFGAGYQLAGGRNDNAVTRLKCGDDLLIRTSYLFSLEDFSIIPQLLFIKRLSKSSILDTNSTNESFIEVDKSDQSQLNLLIQLQYEMSRNFALIADGAIPFINREVNVDGLTRAYTFSLGAKYKLN